MGNGKKIVKKENYCSSYCGEEPECDVVEGAEAEEAAEAAEAVEAIEVVEAGE